MAGGAGGRRASRREKALGDAVFERMEGDDGEPALGLQQMLGGAQAASELEQLTDALERYLEARYPDGVRVERRLLSFSDLG